MFRILQDYPDTVLAVSGSGRITTEDYRDTLAPALAARRSSSSGIRLLYQLDEGFDRFATTALWDDAQLGMHHLDGFDRVAVVTDLDWLRALAERLKPASGCPVRAFSNAELAAARAWILDKL